MTVSIANILETARISMASFTGVNVTVGLPDDSESGLYIFACKFSEDASLRNLQPSESQEMVSRPICVGCLLMANPWNNYGALDNGLRCLTEQPLVTSNTSTVSVTLEDMSTQDLSLIFLSAHVTYRLAIPFQLKET